MPRYMEKKNPTKRISVPNKPKKCIGRFPNLLKKDNVIRSRKPFINLSGPYFVLP